MKIGRELKGGEVIELIGDLGAGKTAFVRGLVKGMGGVDNVRSPSFTLSNQYNTGDLTLHHFDFYRLHEPGIMRNEIEEVLQDPKAVVAVEWAEAVKDALPAERLKIVISATAESGRHLYIKYPDELSYLLPELDSSRKEP
jgi:tRNA threonylcarbamoyladenosine biosynthesis protein TsaE